MTDITELAQREKFEAWFKSSFHPDKTGPYIKDQLYFAWKAAGAELVEALEKTQQYAKERDAENQDLMLTVGRLRVEREELEARTVTVKLPQRYDLIGETDGNCSLNDAEMAPDNDGVYMRVRDVREMLTAAGIKVEAQ